MKKTKEYLIPFVGLKLGKHHFEYQIDNTFFDLFEYDEFQNSDIKVSVVLEKKIQHAGNQFQARRKSKCTL